MGLLPWDDWFYHLGARRDEVNNLHTEAVSLQDQIQAEVDVFNTHLGGYKSLVAGNGALVIVTNIITMSDAKYSDFQTQVDAIEPPVRGAVPLSVAEVIDEAVGGLVALRGLVKLGKFAKEFFSGGGEAAGETAGESIGEAATEAGVDATAEITGEITGETVGEAVAEGVAETVIEGASLGALGETGIGIFAAVGIDAIFGAINGAKEKEQLDKQIDALNTAVGKSRTFWNTLMSKQAIIDNGVVTEEKRLAGIINQLAHTTDNAPSFNYAFTPTVANMNQYINAQTAALNQYGLLVRIRNGWESAVTRNPAVTKDTFLNSVLLTAPPNVTLKQLQAYWAVLAQYSDTLKAVKN
ncbi:MAG: hypothetical protein AB7K71_07920 [Polyangiaceae bacterium]